MEVFREWQTARGQASNEGDGLQDISTPVENFDAGSLAYWLGKLVQEVVNKDGQRYPGRTLYILITGIKRFLAEKNVLLSTIHYKACVNNITVSVAAWRPESRGVYYLVI